MLAETGKYLHLYTYSTSRTFHSQLPVHVYFELNEVEDHYFLECDPAYFW
jgi:hypothetical protein